MKVIIVPTDFSQPSVNAFGYACFLANKLGARIALVHVMGVPMTSPYANDYSPEVEETMMKNYTSKLNQLVRDTASNDVKLGDLMEGLEISTHLEIGLAVTGINRVAEKLEADYIVMGSTGASGVKAAVWGSVTSLIVRNAKIPVLSVPVHWDKIDFSDVVYAADTVPEKEAKIWSVFEDIHDVKSVLSILHIVEEKDVSMSGVGASLLTQFEGVTESKKFKNIKAVSISGKAVVENIEKWCAESESQLLVVVNHKHGMWNSLFNPSKSKMLVMHNMFPILTIPDAYTKFTQPSSSVLQH